MNEVHISTLCIIGCCTCLLEVVRILMFVVHLYITKIAHPNNIGLWITKTADTTCGLVSSVLLKADLIKNYQFSPIQKHLSTIEHIEWQMLTMDIASSATCLMVRPAFRVSSIKSLNGLDFVSIIGSGHHYSRTQKPSLQWRFFCPFHLVFSFFQKAYVTETDM